MGPYYLLPRKEDIFFKMPLDTLRFIQNTIQEDVIKIYIYLSAFSQVKMLWAVL